MKHPFPAVLGAACLFALAQPEVATAQDGLPAPRVSPPANVTQTIGLSDVTVKYHRPGVKGRKIWGGLVPYGEVWRTGANENTSVEFSSAVTVNGNRLDAGVYSLHTIPGPEQWTVIINEVSNSWGSYAYDRQKDALRVDVVPEEAPFQEWMAFDFTPVSETSAQLSLRWERLRVPVLVEASLDDGMLSAVRKMASHEKAEVGSLATAATWCLEHDTNLEEALGWADRAVAAEKSFTTLGVKANLLVKLGRAAEAAPLQKEAWTVATEEDLSRVGGQLMAGRRYSEAIPVFQLNARTHPESWKAHDQLAEAYRKAGDAEAAIASYSKALELSTDGPTRDRIKATIDTLKGA